MDFRRFKITDEQREYAFRLVRTEDRGNRGRFDGNRERQYTGVLGEVCFADLHGLPRPENGKGFDDGIDFTIHGLGVDLKTMGRNSYPNGTFVNNLVVWQTAYQTDVYVFASIHKKERTFLLSGWETKAQILKTIVPLPEGTVRTRRDGTKFTLKAPTYEVPNARLRPWREARQFLDDLLFCAEHEIGAK